MYRIVSAVKSVSESPAMGMMVALPAKIFRRLKAAPELFIDAIERAANK